MREPPLVVVGPAGSQPARADAEALGFELVDGFVVAVSPWDLRPSRIVCVGPVRSDDEAARALHAAARGAGIIVQAQPGDAHLAALVENLQRVGDVLVEALESPTELAPRDRELVELLGSGLSVTAAAERLYISRRTAQRRLARAKATVGARSTTEAILLVDGSSSPP